MIFIIIRVRISNNFHDFKCTLGTSYRLFMRYVGSISTYSTENLFHFPSTIYIIFHSPNTNEYKFNVFFIDDVFRQIHRSIEYFRKFLLKKKIIASTPNLIDRIALSSISSTPFTRSFESSNSDENFEAASSRSWTGAWTRRTGHPSSSLDKISREWKWSVDETLGHQRPQFQGFYHPPAVSHPRQSLGESDERTRRRGRFTFSR